MSSHRVWWCGLPIWTCPICGTRWIWKAVDAPPRGCCVPWEETAVGESVWLTPTERATADRLLASVGMG